MRRSQPLAANCTSLMRAPACVSVTCAFQGPNAFELETILGGGSRPRQPGEPQRGRNANKKAERPAARVQYHRLRIPI